VTQHGGRSEGERQGRNAHPVLSERRRRREVLSPGIDATPDRDQVPLTQPLDLFLRVPGRVGLLAGEDTSLRLGDSEQLRPQDDV